MRSNWVYNTLFFLFLGSCTYLPEEIEKSDEVRVEEHTGYLSLLTVSEPKSNTGLFFYPGGLVDFHAYIPLMQLIAEEGYPVIILKVTGNAAILNSSKTQRYRDDFQEIDQWVVAGHSLGGIKACMDTDDDPDAFLGLILLASYPYNVDLSNWTGSALSLYGENDLIIDQNEVQDARPLLPPALEVNSVDDIPSSGTAQQSIYHRIDGGNHSQFGDYGFQDGDGEATITREQQQEITAEFILSFFEKNNW